MQEDKLVELKKVKGGPPKTVEMLQKHADAVNALIRLLGPMGLLDSAGSVVDVYATVIDSETGEVTLNRVELKFATVQEEVSADQI